MKVRIEEGRCQGHARCFQICPEVFDLDDQGYVLLTTATPPDSLTEKIGLAERNCPEHAIVLER